MQQHTLIKIIFTLCALPLIFLLFQHHKDLAEGFEISPSAKSFSKIPAFSETGLTSDQPYNHASSLVMSASQKEVFVAWASGKKELDPTVAIELSHFLLRSSLEKRQFASYALFNKFLVEDEEQRYLNSLGNPVLVQYDHKLWLFFVTTMGGWATASINYKVSSDEGETWSKAVALKLSPFLNWSHSLKGGAIFFKDGSLGLPIYHELFATQSKLLRIDNKGHVLSLQNLSGNGQSLQPILVPMTEQQAFVFMRQKRSPFKKIFLNQTFDGGAKWNHFGVSQFDNPDAAVSAVKMDQHQILLAFNDSASDRKTLSLAILKNFNTPAQEVCIIPFKQVEGDGQLVSYPFLIKTGDRYLMSYSDSGHISVVEFNQAWLFKKWKNCTPS